MSKAFEKKTQEKKKQLPSLTPEQKGLLDSLIGNVKGQLGKGITPYGGQIVAGVSPLQRQAFDAAGGFGTDAASFSRRSALEDIVSGKPAYNASPEEYQRVYREGVEAPALAQWQRDIIPQILHQYGSQGGAGAVYDMLGRSGADLATNLASQSAQYRFQGLQDQNAALEAAAGRRLAGVSQSSQESLAPIALASTLGGEQRGIEGDQLASEFYKWQTAQAYNNPWLGFLAPALGTKAFDTFYQPEGKEPTFLAKVLKGLTSPPQIMGGGAGG